MSLFKNLEHTPSSALGVLEIDTSKLVANYHHLQKQAPSALCGAAVKADAYGLGCNDVSYHLALAGCDHFFVVHLEEGVSLREHLTRTLPNKNPIIYVMSGVLPNTEDLLIHHNLTPTLITPNQVNLWKNAALKCQKQLGAVLHFDTGMARTGLSVKQAQDLANNLQDLEGIRVELVMSHLACSNELDNPFNQRQLQAFERLGAMFPNVPQSLSNSSGIFLGKEFQKNLVRPGAGIYGLSLTKNQNSNIPGIQNVISLRARIVQIQDIPKGATVGYGGTFKAPRPTRVATLGVGYADGYIRDLGNIGIVKIGDHFAPIIGRVSMDFATVDVTDIPENEVHENGWALVLGDDVYPQDMAEKAGTISYELAVNLSRRYHRRYTK